MKSRFTMFLCAVVSGCASAPPAQDPKALLAERLEWFQDQKFGFMIHWGIYSQWGCIESWPLVPEDKWARPDTLACWTERGKDIKRFQREYFALNKTFNPRKFDPEKWVEAAKYAGMKYFCYTTKHHDGFSMFDTKQTDFRTTHPSCPFSGNPDADTVKVLFDAFHKEGFGIWCYYSKSDWHHGGYWDPEREYVDRNPNYDTLAETARWDSFVKFVHGQIEELMSGYGPIDVLFLDGGQVRPPRQDIRMDEMVAMARKHQPGLIVTDRTVGGEHENYHTPEQTVPDKPQPFVWESCLTMGKQWSHKPDDDYKSVHTLVQMLVDIVAKGGNFLLNVGPTPDGELPPPALERMKGIGDWMKVNSEAIYATRAVAPYKEGKVAFTKKGDVVYAIYLADGGETGPPEEISLSSFQPRVGSSVQLLGSDSAISWEAKGKGVALRIPEGARKRPPCKDAFVFRMEVGP